MKRKENLSLLEDGRSIFISIASALSNKLSTNFWIINNHKIHNNFYSPINGCVFYVTVNNCYYPNSSFKNMYSQVVSCCYHSHNLFDLKNWTLQWFHLTSFQTTHSLIICCSNSRNQRLVRFSLFFSIGKYKIQKTKYVQYI